MPRYAAIQPTASQATVEGDSFFDRVDMKLDRSTLPVGTLALSINKRLRSKTAKTRKGIWPPVSMNILAPTRIYGFGVYSNPNGNEVLLVALNYNSAAAVAHGAPITEAGDDNPVDAIFSMRDDSYPREVTITPGTVLDQVEFVQANDKIFIFRGTDASPFVWDGVSNDGFAAITKSDPLDTSTALIPNAVTAEQISDRLLIINGTSDVIATDILDYTSYDAILEVFHVGREAGNPIVRVFNYAKGTAIVFCQRSTYLLLNFIGDPADAVIELLNSTLGLAGRKACVMVGGDVLFLSEPGGIYRIAQAFESRMQTAPLPVSDAIQPLIDRINWKAASGAVAVILGEYVRFFVPIDSSTRNNAAIIYNGATGVVEGYDTWADPMRVDDVAVTLYEGKRRLYALDKQAARIYVLDEGESDFIYDPDLDTTAEYPIEDVIETRGYATLGWNAATRRDFKRVELGVLTQNPSITVTELTESAGGDRALHVNAITKSPTAYQTFGRKDWDATNVNDDWDTLGREDYSLFADSTGFELGSGIEVDRKQASTLRFSTKARGRYISYRIENNQGTAEVIWSLVESSGTQREPRRAG